jgi:DNA-binding beta-propeller fold protein YncE
MKRILSALAFVSCLASAGFAGEPVRPGHKLSGFGREGVGPGQMSEVEYVAVDPQGFIYTVDTELNRVQRFDAAGTLDSLFYFRAGQRVEAIAVDRDSTLYMIVNGRLFQYDPSTWTPLGEVQRPGSYEFHAVAARHDGGILALGEGKKAELLFIEKGKVVRLFECPVLRYVDVLGEPTLAEDAKGFVYVADSLDNTIHKIGPDGRYISHFGSFGHEPGQFSDHIEGLAVDEDGQIWAVDSQGCNVFAADGRSLRRFGYIEGEGSTGAGNELYVADRSSVVKYAMGKIAPAEGAEETEEEEEPAAGEDPWRDFAKPAGSEGTRPGPMSEALRTGRTVERGGTLYAVSEGRLFHYTAAGTLMGEVKHPDGAGFFHVAPRPDFGVIATWHNAERDDVVLVGKGGEIETVYRNAVTGAVGAVGAVGEPVGDTLVAMDGRRNFYVAVPRLSIVCVFNFRGEYQNRFGSAGEEPGQFSGPVVGLTVDGQENVFTADGKWVSVFHGPEARFLRRVESTASALAVTDGDQVLAAVGTEVVELPAGGTW